jgi:predicted nucleotidyltransferase
MRKPNLNSFPEGISKENIILLGYGGSQAYGTETPESDYDYKGLLVPPIRFYLSPFQSVEQVAWANKPEEEGVIYAIQKFLSLAAKSNPNMIELLFLDPNDYYIMTPEGEKLIQNRNLFLSQKAVFSFCGYAISQLKRIETHKRWISNPRQTPPSREEFGLNETASISEEKLRTAEAIVRRYAETLAPWLLDADNENKEAFWISVQNMVALGLEKNEDSFDEYSDSWLATEQTYMDALQTKLGFDTDFIIVLRKEKLYSQAMNDYRKYQHWLKTRNPFRAAIEQKFGFDTKHAMHLVRLLRMGEELITQGTVHVKRPDAELLLSIREGLWSYDQVLEFSNGKVEELYKMVREGKTKLPKEPDYKAIERLMLDLYT